MSNPRPIRVMIVDDNPSVTQGLSTFLESKTDVEVVADASYGVEAIERCIKQKPDVVLMDMVLPDMTGVEVMQALKVGLPWMQFIFLTSSNGPHLQNAAPSIGAAAILSKDITGETLVNTIRIAVGQITRSANGKRINA